MTTPPGPSDDTPPHGFDQPAFGPQSFEPQGIPPAYPGFPPPPPGYPAYPYPPPQPQRRISVLMVILGPFLYAALNLVVGFLALMVAGSVDSTGNGPVAAVGGAAVLLALIAFGGGAALLASKNPAAKGLGIGLMVGWALVSLFSAGFCTGINPSVYSL
jgi:hypothetical protein